MPSPNSIPIILPLILPPPAKKTKRENLRTYMLDLNEWRSFFQLSKPECILGIDLLLSVTPSYRPVWPKGASTPTYSPFLTCLVIIPSFSPLVLS